MAKELKRKARASRYSYKRIDVWLSNEAVAMADRMDDERPDRTEELRRRLIRKLRLMAERLNRISDNEHVSARGERIARHFARLVLSADVPDLAEARREAKRHAKHLSTLQRQSWHERLARLLEDLSPGRRLAVTVQRLLRTNFLTLSTNFLTLPLARAMAPCSAWQRASAKGNAYANSR